MIERHLMKLRARDEVSADEEAVIRASVAGTRRVEAGQVAVRAHTPLDVSSILLSSLAGRVKDLADGRRQVTEIHTPGDYTDLHSFTLKYLDHEVRALSDCEFAVVPHSALKAMTEQHPHLTRLYWFATNLDGAVHREWELSLGRRTALERMAHLFCELLTRLSLVGLADENAYELKLTQEELGECLGLTPVHVNRTLKQLREEGVAEFKRGRVTIRDLARVQTIASFDPAYLYLERRPR